MTDTLALPEVDTVDWASLQPPCEARTSLALFGIKLRERRCENAATWVCQILCERCGVAYHSLRCDQDLNPVSCCSCNAGSYARPAVIVVGKVKL